VFKDGVSKRGWGEKKEKGLTARTFQELQKKKKQNIVGGCEPLFRAKKKQTRNDRGEVANSLKEM